MIFSEKELVNGLRPGNISAFDLLFRSYSSGLNDYSNTYLNPAFKNKEKTKTDYQPVKHPTPFNEKTRMDS